MPDQLKADLIMQFVKDGRPVLAECALDKDPKDDFMTGFIPADYNRYSNFFEVQKFSFGVAVKDEDSAKNRGQGKGQPGAAHSAGATVQAHGHGHGQTYASGTANANAATRGKPKDGFKSWRSATDKQAKKIDFVLEPDTFSFTRLIDRASPVFFEALCNSETFESATLVKRVAVGSLFAADSSLRVNTRAASQGFLQMVFTKVLIINLDWDDGDLVTENCKFICKGFKISYKQQQDSGQLGKTFSAQWEQEKDSLARREAVS